MDTCSSLAVRAPRLRQLSRIQTQGKECSRVPPLTHECAMPGSRKGSPGGGEGGEVEKEIVEQTGGTHMAALKDEVSTYICLLPLTNINRL